MASSRGQKLLLLTLSLFASLLPSFGEDSCGDGYRCTFSQNGEVYGCAKIEGPTKDSPMVCCTAGESDSGCSRAGVNGTTVPHCPANGATGPGCWRLSEGHNSHSNAQTSVSYEEECGDGHTCYENEVAYGCAKLPLTGNDTLVCCSVGETDEVCSRADTNGTQLPHCPAGGATGQGCLRARKEKSDAHHLGSQQDTAELFLEECGPGYTCVATQYAYGCAKMPVSTGNYTMVCCTPGQPEEACAKSSKTSTPLPYCPAGGAKGSGCLREQRRGSEKTSRGTPLEKTRPVTLN